MKASDHIDPFSATAKQRQEDMAERGLNRRVHDFIETWGPRPPGDRSQFCADLLTIVQIIHADAVAKWGDYITAATMKMTSAPFIIVDKDKASKP